MKTILIIASTLLITACSTPSHHQVESHRHTQAALYEKAGDYEYARRLYTTEMFHARLGHPPESGIATTYYNLGRVKGYLCDKADAEMLLLKALEERQGGSEADSNISSKYLLELAMFYFDNERYASSVPYYSRGIAMAIKHGQRDNDPVALAQMYDDYSSALKQTGQRAEAERAGEAAAELRANNRNQEAVSIPKRYNQNCPDTNGEE
jgi:tetratricopeptide (TPR) repeat protein